MKKKEMFLIFNGTDGIFASPEEFTKAKALKFIKDFPKRFESQGFYRTGSGKRIPASMVILSLVPLDGEEVQLFNSREETKDFFNLL